jgi:hypothetical protein
METARDPADDFPRGDYAAFDQEDDPEARDLDEGDFDETTALTDPGVSPTWNLRYQPVVYPRRQVGLFEGLDDSEILDVVNGQLVVEYVFVEGTP